MKKLGTRERARDYILPRSGSRRSSQLPALLKTPAAFTIENVTSSFSCCDFPQLSSLRTWPWAPALHRTPTARTHEETNGQRSHPETSTIFTAEAFSPHVVTFVQTSCLNLSPHPPLSSPWRLGFPQGQPAPATVAVGVQIFSLDTGSWPRCHVHTPG